MSVSGTLLRSLLYCSLVFALTLHPPARSQTSEPASASKASEAPAGPEDELDSALAAARPLMKQGPADIALRDQAMLKLPMGYDFVPAQSSARIMHALGNHTGKDLVGLVLPDDGESSWFVVVTYERSGYIRDDDAKNWDADELLNSLKEGTEATNKERRARGIPEIDILGWVEKPHYDPESHHLIWSVSSKHKGSPETADKGINYNTYALGRDGYIAMNLVTNLAYIAEDKPVARRLLASLDFNAGKRYGDFDSSTDKVAAYGLAALVAGVAAKKLCLTAIMAAFATKFFKLIVTGVIAAGAVISRIWKRKSAS